MLRSRALLATWAAVKPVKKKVGVVAASNAGAGAATATSKVIKRRALQCSFSSVFYLKDVVKPEDFQRIKTLFIGSVMIPFVGLGAVASLQAAYTYFS